MTDREKEILSIIKNDPMVSQQQIAEELDITRSSVSVHISNLISKGYIKGRGYLINDKDYVVCIGGSNIDIIGTPNYTSQRKDSIPGYVSFSYGGVARNVSENLSKFNVDVKLISAIGKDSNGLDLIKHSNISNIDTSHSLLLEKESTAVYMAILNDVKDMELAISDMEIIKNIDEKYLSKKYNLLKNSSIIFADTNLEEEALRYLLVNFDNVFIDPVSRSKSKKLRKYMKYIHTIKPNIYETEILIGKKIKTEDDLILAGKKLVSLGIKNVYISVGKEGVYYFNKNNFLKAKSDYIDMKNATGAGDAFMSGVIYGHMNNLQVEEILKLGIASSRISLKNINTTSDNLSLENIEKEKEAIYIC